MRCARSNGGVTGIACVRRLSELAINRGEVMKAPGVDQKIEILAADFLVGGKHLFDNARIVRHEPAKAGMRRSDRRIPSQTRVSPTPRISPGPDAGNRNSSESSGGRRCGPPQPRGDTFFRRGPDRRLLRRESEPDPVFGFERAEARGDLHGRVRNSGRPLRDGPQTIHGIRRRRIRDERRWRKIRWCSRGKPASAAARRTVL